MRKYIFLLLAVFVGIAGAASIKEDIVSQGKVSYMHQTLTEQQLATMVRDYETLTAADTLTYSECGKTIFLNSATEFATTLPSPVAGCYFRFIVKAAPSGANYTVVTASSANIIYGSVEVNGAVVAGVTEDTVSFVSAAAAIGDWVDLVSDGTNWYLSGSGVGVGAITLTAT